MYLEVSSMGRFIFGSVIKGKIYIWKSSRVDLYMYLEVSSMGRAIFGSVIKAQIHIWRCHQGVELYLGVSSR